LDSSAGSIFVLITLAGLAGVGEDRTECAIWVAESVVVSGAAACIRCTPVMVASLPRETNIIMRKLRSKIFHHSTLFKQDKFGPGTHDRNSNSITHKVMPNLMPK